MLILIWQRWGTLLAISTFLCLAFQAREGWGWWWMVDGDTILVTVIIIKYIFCVM